MTSPEDPPLYTFRQFVLFIYLDPVLTRTQVFPLFRRYLPIALIIPYHPNPFLPLPHRLLAGSLAAPQLQGPRCCCGRSGRSAESLPHHSTTTSRVTPYSSLTTTALELNQTKHLYLQPMFSRLSQLARHFSRPLPNYAHNSAAALSSKTSRIMTSSSAAAATADERNSRMIHTAACLIIGDEVLGGKVRLLINYC